MCIRIPADNIQFNSLNTFKIFIRYTIPFWNVKTCSSIVAYILSVFYTCYFYIAIFVYNYKVYYIKRFWIYNSSYNSTTWYFSNLLICCIFV
nr:MAG TPA: hypothetical protein [Caudoviricetes sp.]